MDSLKSKVAEYRKLETFAHAACLPDEANDLIVKAISVVEADILATRAEDYQGIGAKLDFISAYLTENEGLGRRDTAEMLRGVLSEVDFIRTASRIPATKRSHCSVTEQRPAGSVKAFLPTGGVQ